MFKAPSSHIIMIILILFAVSGCSSALEEAPSLNKRTFEISLEEMRVLADNKGADGDSFANSAIISRKDIGALVGTDVKSLWERHIKADAAFASESRSSRSVVGNARSSGFGSDKWAAAHVSLSRLDRIRAPSLTSLSAIDEIVFTELESRIATNQDDKQDLSILIQMQKYVESDVNTQTQFIDGLSNALVAQ